MQECAQRSRTLGEVDGGVAQDVISWLYSADKGRVVEGEVFEECR
jgi:hypothetical protein